MDRYIVQNMTKYNDISHFNEALEKDYYMSFIDDRRGYPNFSELYNFKYIMVVAEPGYGKTRLLKELVLKGNDNNIKVFFLDSKQIKNSVLDSIQKCKIIEENISEEKLQKKVHFSNTDDFNLDENTIVCLDALDELPFSNLYDFFEKIEEFISDYPDIRLFVSCRTHHLKKVDYDLSKISFEYIMLDEFYDKQIFDYLKDSGLSTKDIKEIEKKSKLVNLYEYLTIPRYLYYFSEIIKDKGRNIEEIVHLSRSELFEEFIYRKIDKERDKKYPESENHTIKRVLEELALVMKIFQVSQISKDDFFTVFKELNLGSIFTGKGLIEKLSEKSLLKDNIDYLEFENQEFLDFLAAKELSRFEKIDQVFFDMAVEPHFQEVFTSWFYVMPFVLEQHPFMINLVLDFLEKNSNKVLREKYFDVITSIDPNYIDEKVKSRIFNIVFDYHFEHSQWLRPNKLIHFYIKDEHYQKIVDSIDCDIDTNKVKIKNAIEIIEELSKYGWLLEDMLQFWKDQFLEWLNLDVKKYKNLHRTIISSCSVIMKNDFEWMKSIYFIFENGIEVQHEYSRACYKISPNDQFSIDIYFQCDKQFNKNKIDRASRLDDNVRYISKVNTQGGIQYILEKITSKDGEKDLNYILYESYKGRFQDDIKQFVSNIQDNISNEILALLKKLIINLLIKIGIHHGDKSKHLFKELFNTVMKKDANYILELIDKLYKAYLDGKLHYFKVEDIILYDLSEYLNDKNFDDIYKKLKKIDDENERMDLKHFMVYRLYSFDRLDEFAKNKIEKLYKKEIKELEVNQKKYQDKRKRDEINKQLGLCRQWEHKIEPEPNKFVTDLFYFYMNNKETLMLCENFEENRNKTIDTAKDVIKWNNPLKGEVTVNGNTSSIRGVSYFKKAIKLLYEENIELKKQDLIDNVFRYLPFDINSNYEITLKLAHNPSPKAIQDILDVYSGEKREDDLDIYHPQNFIEFYKLTKIKESEPLLLKMLYNPKIEKYIREQIVNTLPKEVLIKEEIYKYIETKSEDDELYEDMLIALVKNFDDKEAIRKVFEIVIKKGIETEISEDAAYLMDTSLGLDRTYNKLVHTLIKIDYDVEEDKKLLEIAVNLRNQGKDLNADFFEEIVFRHLKFLNHKSSFEPLIKIETYLQENKSKINLNSFEYKFKELKDVYLDELAKPKHIMEAIKSYKRAKENEYLVMNSPLHLLEIIKEAINEEIKHWIEVEGAYKHIDELAKKNVNTNAEDFIQKTLKSQIELALLKRGLRHTDIRIKREEQTLDDKRADFTISYGFIGQILLELKLSHNYESKSTRKDGREYKNKLKQYIEATNSDYGIFIIFNIEENNVVFRKQMEKLTKFYVEDNIFILGIDCKK